MTDPTVPLCFSLGGQRRMCKRSRLLALSLWAVSLSPPTACNERRKVVRRQRLGAAPRNADLFPDTMGGPSADLAGEKPLATIRRARGQDSHYRHRKSMGGDAHANKRRDRWPAREWDPSSDSLLCKIDNGAAPTEREREREKKRPTRRHAFPRCDPTGATEISSVSCLFPREPTLAASQAIQTLKEKKRRAQTIFLVVSSL